MKIIILILLTPLLSSCAGFRQADSDSRQLAFQTYQQVLNLHEKMSMKIAAERQFYRDQEKTIWNAYHRLAHDEIEKSRNSSARALIEALVQDPSKATPEFLVKHIGPSVQNGIEEAQKRDAQRRASMQLKLNTIEKLEGLSANYAELERPLLGLSEKETENRLPQTFDFLKRTYDHYRTLEKKARMNQNPN